MKTREQIDKDSWKSFKWYNKHKKEKFYSEEEVNQAMTRLEITGSLSDIHAMEIFKKYLYKEW